MSQVSTTDGGGLSEATYGELREIAALETDQLADHRDRYDVPDDGHELGGALVDRAIDAVGRDAGDLGFE